MDDAVDDVTDGVEDVTDGITDGIDRAADDLTEDNGVQNNQENTDQTGKEYRPGNGREPLNKGKVSEKSHRNVRKFLWYSFENPGKEKEGSML